VAYPEAAGHASRFPAEADCASPRHASGEEEESQCKSWEEEELPWRTHGADENRQE